MLPLSCHEEGSLAFWDSYPCPISNPRVISQIWLLSVPLTALPPLQNREQQGWEAQSPSPASQNCERFRHSPQDLEISWNDNSGPSRSQRPTSSCCPVGVHAKPPSPSTLLWRGAARGPGPSADAESRMSIVLLLPVHAKSTQQAKTDDVGCFQTPITAAAWLSLFIISRWKWII